MRITAGRIWGDAPTDPPTAADLTRTAKRERDARVEAARRNQRWEELPEARLVRRGWKGSILVDAVTDHCYTLFPGTTFHGAAIAFNADAPLFFYVDENTGPVMLERQPGSWSQRYERQARAEARKKAAAS